MLSFDAYNDFSTLTYCTKSMRRRRWIFHLTSREVLVDKRGIASSFPLSIYLPSLCYPSLRNNASLGEEKMPTPSIQASYFTVLHAIALRELLTPWLPAGLHETEDLTSARTIDSYRSLFLFLLFLPLSLSLHLFSFLSLHLSSYAGKARGPHQSNRARLCSSALHTASHGVHCMYDMQ